MKTFTTSTFRIILLLAFPLLMTQCSKDDDDNDNQTPSELIIGSWQVTADVVTPPLDFGSGPISDLYSILDACDKDDLYIIKANGVGEFNEGASKCDPADPQSEPFSWSLQDNGTVLVISDGSSSANFQVAQLNQTTMKLVITESILGTTYTETITYTRK